MCDSSKNVFIESLNVKRILFILDMVYDKHGSICNVSVIRIGFDMNITNSTGKIYFKK